jgi:hypothetical protein
MMRDQALYQQGRASGSSTPWLSESERSRVAARVQVSHTCRSCLRRTKKAGSDTLHAQHCVVMLVPSGAGAGEGGPAGDPAACPGGGCGPAAGHACAQGALRLPGRPLLPRPKKGRVHQRIQGACCC